MWHNTRILSICFHKTHKIWTDYVEVYSNGFKTYLVTNMDITSINSFRFFGKVHLSMCLFSLHLCILSHFCDVRIYTKFQDNPTNNLVSGTWSKTCSLAEGLMYGHGFHIWRIIFNFLIRNLYVCGTQFQATFLSKLRVTSMWHCIKF